MTRVTLAFSVLLFVAACSSMDRQAMTKFEPLDNGRFRYEAATDAVYPADSPRAEAARRRWLDQYVRDNNICRNGYVIERRKKVLVRRAALANMHRIYYYGRCK